MLVPHAPTRACPSSHCQSRYPRPRQARCRARDGRIVGAHLIGAGAGDVILAASLAIQTGMTVEQLAGGWNPYLTLGEGLYLAAQAFTRDPGKLSCCAA